MDITKVFRSSVIKNAVQIYNSKVLVASEGGRPLYRPFGYQSEQNAINKVISAQTWYSGKSQQRNQAPLILDPTPTGEMEKEIQAILSNAARTTDVRIKLCTMGGRKISSKAKSDPFASIQSAAAQNVLSVVFQIQMEGADLAI